MKAIIEAGAAGVHFEDQLASEKKCGHLGGKVLVPTSQFIRTLVAARLAADVLDVPTVLVARTDALAATLLTSDVDERDAGVRHRRADARGLLPRGDGPRRGDRPRRSRTRRTRTSSGARPRRRTSRRPRPSPTAIHARVPGQAPRLQLLAVVQLARAPRRRRRSRRFQERLAAMGYRFQFITLAGFHSLNAGDVRARARLRARKACPRTSASRSASSSSRRTGYTATRHQREVGAGLLRPGRPGRLRRRELDARAQGLDRGGAVHAERRAARARARPSRPAANGMPTPPPWVAVVGPSRSHPLSQDQPVDGAAAESHGCVSISFRFLALVPVPPRAAFANLRARADPRLADAARSRSCRRRPGPVRMYVCGPTVYQRIHVGNARPYVVFLWLRNWLRERGLRGDARREHHRRQRQDLRRRARARAIPSAELAARATRVVPRGHRGPRDRPAGRRAARDGDDPGDRRADRGPRRARPRVRVAGRRVLPGRVVAGVRRALGREPRRHGRAGAERPEGGPARLRALEGDEAARGHVVGIALGARPAGLAHRVLGDGGEAPRPRVRAPRRRPRPALPAPRERDRAVARRRPPVLAHLGAQRDARVRRREDGEVGRQRRLAPRRARPLGPRGDPHPLPRRALPEPGRLHRGRDRAGARAVGRLPHGLSRRCHPGRRARRGTTSRPRSTTTSGRRRRSRSCTSGGPRGGSTSSPAGSRSSGSRPASRRARRRPTMRALAEQRQDRPVPPATSRRPTGCATRSRPRAGRCRTWPDGFRLIPQT